jgi:hypothetical protein
MTKGKATAGRCVAFSDFKILFSYTVEASFVGMDVLGKLEEETTMPVTNFLGVDLVEAAKQREERDGTQGGASSLAMLMGTQPKDNRNTVQVPVRGTPTSESGGA